MSSKKFVLYTIICFITIPAVVMGSGFAIYEHGVSANGLAGAFGGIANDASAIYYNPAALSFLEPGAHLTVGTTFIIPRFSWNAIVGIGPGEFPTARKVDMNDKMFFPSNLYYAIKSDGNFSYGVGFFNPFGLGTDWPEDWEGRFNLISVDLKTFFLNPTVAYSINSQLSIAVGVDIAHATAELIRRNAEVLGAEPLAEISGSGNGVGFNAAVAYKANDKLTVGASYRSEVDFSIKGDATVTEAAAVLQPLLPGGDVTLDITTPTTITAGFGYDVSEKITLDLDYTWVGWSSFDRLIIDFETETFSPSSGAPVQADQTLREEWKDVWNIRIGALVHATDDIDLQFGFLTDNNPAQDKLLSPLLPDSDRMGISAGISKKMGDQLTVNLSYIHLFFKERTITNSELESPLNGTYNGSAELLGFGINYDFY